MAWGQEKGADVKISALRACQYEIFDFVPCSLPLKTLILLTFSCFLIRRRGKELLFCRGTCVFVSEDLFSNDPGMAHVCPVAERDDVGVVSGGELSLIEPHYPRRNVGDHPDRLGYADSDLFD